MSKRPAYQPYSQPDVMDRGQSEMDMQVLDFAIRCVGGFHDAHGLGNGVRGEIPAEPEWDLINERLKLIEEEYHELFGALDDRDIVGIASESIDLIYVVLGTMEKLGIDPSPIFLAIHDANMAKAGGEVDDNGKLRKPKGWKPADIRGEMIRQGWTPPGEKKKEGAA